MNSSLGRLVKDLRDKKGWTQEELAEKSGLSIRAIQRIEAGETKRPNSDTLQRLATALEIDVAELQKARWDGIASGTAQTPSRAPGNDETVTSMPRNPTEPTAPSRDKRKL